ncbi:MAG: hypothetical protein JOZ62_21140 [Acidobacteriaceae bacterium]|nr:hypothetical protein [Acidobacteriaceae bacterium]
MPAFARTAANRSCFQHRASLYVTAIAATLTALVPPASALDPSKALTQYAHRIWGQEEGLFQPTIYSILQTRDGFLWLGTQDSLIRFDGIHFREIDRRGQALFHGNLVHSLLEDRAGNLWVGSIGNGVARMGQDGSFTRYGVSDGFPSDNAFCLASDSQNALWVCTDKGLARSLRNRVQVFTTADGLPGNRIRAACEATDRTLWVAGFDFPLARSNGTRFEAYSGPGILPRDTVTVLQCPNDGSVWVGKDSGVTRIQGTHTRMFTVADGLPDNSVSALALAPDGAVWIGTEDGITRYRNGEISVYRTRDGLSHSLVLSLYTDREGSLWAGTKDGLDQFTDPKVTPYTMAQGLSSNEAGPVIEDTQGRLWIGTLDSGLNLSDGRTFRKITTADGLTSNRIVSLEVDRHGDVWAGTSNGLNRLRNGKVISTYRERSGLSGSPVRDKFGSYPLTGVSRPVDCGYVDSEHDSVWMGTLGSGLLRWHNGALAHIHVKDGLYDNRIYAILRDGHSNFWMASSKGIFRVGMRELEDFADGKRKSVTSIPFTTGQLRFECRSGVQPGACRTHDGRLWFSTTSGLVVVDPDHLAAGDVPPPVSITALLADGRRVETGQALRLKPSERNLDIRYAGLSFVSPEKVTFRYILEGYEKAWTDAGTRREAFFTNLPPGNFRFKVIARNADGLWSREAAAIDFSVEPLFYQQLWFWPAVAVLISLTIAAGYRRRVVRLKQQFDAVLAERSRIARELHDTLLQGLSGITMQLQALWARLPASREKETLRDIIGDAGRCSTEARQSLWGLRTRDPNSLSFSEKLDRLSREGVMNTPASLRLRLEFVSLAGLPELEYQLLRIAQESISNAVKYAAATTITIELSKSSRELNLSVQDDGEGFETGVHYEQHGHFGLLGIKERARNIHAVLELSSSPHGTLVRVRVPLSSAAAREPRMQHAIQHQPN